MANPDSMLLKTVPGKDASSHRMPQKFSRTKSRPKANPINPMKSRLRSLTRLLSHKSATMPADQMLSLQREEQLLRSQIQYVEAKEKRSRMITKYHKVRFFERRKAERRLKQAKQNHEKSQEHDIVEGIEQDTSSRKTEVELCEVDLNYTLYFPLETRYESLYVKGETGEELVVRNKDMWSAVQEAMATNKLELLRDGRWLPNTMQEQKSDKPHDRKQDGTKLGFNGLPSTSVPTGDARRVDERESAMDEGGGHDDGDGADFFEKGYNYSQKAL